MDVKLRNVGNSLTATIPNEIVVMLNLRSGDIVSVSEKNGFITINPKKRKIRGIEYLENYYAKPIDEIGLIDTEVVDTGEPMGAEEW